MKIMYLSAFVCVYGLSQYYNASLLQSKILELYSLLFYLHISGMDTPLEEITPTWSETFTSRAIGVILKMIVLDHMYDMCSPVHNFINIPNCFEKLTPATDI